ncbi:MAG: nucleotidyl transferase AbiEii/AbiGii toxin family protein [Bryobacterales bacterium]|jgi:predicted nucleotidyltransferase component of viral defense system|nr:nucleotidyl transferase AbiEii/AbiGii toxin family protein [Bryobacterales bacterium]
MKQRTERLEKALARVARDQGIDQERLRRWVSFLALCGVLERAVAEGVIGSYYLKGGVAMELRFAQLARATKDLDLALTGDRKQRLQSLHDSIGLGFDEFTFRLKAQIREMEQADTVRVEVAIQYRTRSWQTVEIDLGPSSHAGIELVAPKVIGLAELGIPLTSPIRCIHLADQIAQKIHACTGPFSAGRARDVLDILLIEDLGQLEFPQVREAVIRIFRERATHDLPAVFTLPSGWPAELESLAVELSIPTRSAGDIERRFQTLLAMLA